MLGERVLLLSRPRGFYKNYKNVAQAYYTSTTTDAPKRKKIFRRSHGAVALFFLPKGTPFATRLQQLIEGKEQHGTQIYHF